MGIYIDVKSAKWQTEWNTWIDFLLLSRSYFFGVISLENVNPHWEMLENLLAEKKLSLLFHRPPTFETNDDYFSIRRWRPLWLVLFTMLVHSTTSLLRKNRHLQITRFSNQRRPVLHFSANGSDVSNAASFCRCHSNVSIDWPIRCKWNQNVPGNKWIMKYTV